MLWRTLIGLTLAFASLPAEAQIDDTDYSYPELSTDDGLTIRREQSEIRQQLNAGTSALESGDWSAAQWSCLKAEDAVLRSDFRGQDAYIQARTIGRTCMADAAYEKGNTKLACEWWEMVDYESLIGLNPREICLSGETPARPDVGSDSEANEARDLAFEDLLQIMTDEIVDLTDAPVEDPTRSPRIERLAETCKSLTAAAYLGQTMVGFARFCEGHYYGFKMDKEMSCSSYRLSFEALASIGDPVPASTTFAEHITSARKILNHYFAEECS